MRLVARVRPTLPLLCAGLLLGGLGVRDAAADESLPERVVTVPTRPADLEAGAPRLVRRCCPQRRASGWTWRASLPLWVPIVRGSLASGDVRVESGSRTRSTTPWDWLGDVDVADTASGLEFFFVGGLEATHGRWSFGVEAEHAELGATLDWRVADGAVDGSLQGTIARAWARYALICQPGAGCRPSFSIGPTLGARLYAIEASAKGNLVDFDRSKTWLEATLGVDAQATWRNGFGLRVAADVACPGTDSGTSWFAMAEASWRFSRRFSLSLGWAWHAIDFSRGRGPDLFDLDLLLSGPRMALTVTF